MTIMLIGLGGLVQLLLQNFALIEQSRCMAIAVREARTRIEGLQGADMSTTFTSLNNYTPDNPVGATGPHFAVAGLAPDPEDADGFVGEYAFPVASGSPGNLSETAAGFPGMPRDLNFDGDAVDTDVNATSRMLPVVLRLRWQDTTGVVQRYELRAFLFGPP
jgi:hypothetical protein